MIVNIAHEATMVSDYETEEMMEQPIIIEQMSGSESISIMAHDGSYVNIPYRMMPEVIRVIKGYLPKK
jgi:hypothetical protein